MSVNDPVAVSRPLAANSSRKRPVGEISHSKRVRSKIPRRRRIPLLPIVGGEASIHQFDAEDEAESSSSCFRSELSFDTGLRFSGSDASKALVRAPRQARASKPITGVQITVPCDEFRRVTRSYAKQQEQLRMAAEMEAKSIRGGVKSLKAEVSEGSVSRDIAASEVSHVSGGVTGRNLKQTAVASTGKTPVISESSCLESVSKVSFPEILHSVTECSKVQISEGCTTRVAEPIDLDLTSDLACSERLTSLDDGDEGSSENSPFNELKASEYERKLFFSSPESDFSDYSTSDLVDSSGDDFSERSGCSSEAPTATFSLFLQFTRQLVRLSIPTPFGIQHCPIESFILMKFAEDEDEESYKALRDRERRDVVRYYYGNDNSSSMGISDQVLRQRLRMVNWIVENSILKVLYATDFELQSETLFLGVSLMDRFLSRGYFNSDSNLQLLGVACVTLAIRIEENQPYNSIRRKTFTVRNNVYSRCEVVAMEWLVMEVLKFQCFVPTTFNFLWFYLKAARADPEVKDLTHYLAVLSLLDHDTLRFWPSTVAAGLVILACLATDRDSSCHDVMETHVRTRNDDLSECIQSLEWLVSHARERD